jgi:parvulin-like peptidyl-prolyl isomerase
MKKFVTALLLALVAAACAQKTPERPMDASRKIILSVVLIGYSNPASGPEGPKRTPAEAKARAQELHAGLQSGKLTFEEAVASSDDVSTRDHLGYVGVYRFGDLPLALEPVVFALQPGEVSAPVDSGIGWALYKRELEEGIRGLNHILISFKGALHSPLAISRTKEQALEMARQARQDLLAGAPFVDAAKKYSNGLEAKRRGYLGWMIKKALLPEHREAVWPLKDGEVSEVLETPMGFHLYQFVPPWPDTIGLKHIMVAYQGALLAPFSITRSKDEAKQRAQEVLARLKKGDAWDTLTKKYSDDKSTSASGGDLGIIPLNIIPTELEGVAFTSPLHQASGVVESPGGFHILLRYK